MPFDATELLELVIAMLGMGVLRTYEKARDINEKH
jgi:hypothetical protein